jgi:hypothetical protein
MDKSRVFIVRNTNFLGAEPVNPWFPGKFESTVPLCRLHSTWPLSREPYLHNILITVHTACTCYTC